MTRMTLGLSAERKLQTLRRKTRKLTLFMN